MANQGRELYEFGPFRLDPERRLLLCRDEPVALQLKAFETLLVLVRNSQQVVLKDELMQSVWPDTFVEESNLAQNIFVLRKTLAANSGDQTNQRYIATIPGRGYRFAEQVRVLSEEDALFLQRQSRTRVLIEEKVALPEATTTAVVTTQPQVATHTLPARVAISAALLAALLVVAFILRPTLPPPRVTGIHQITHLGNLVHNTHLITDGPRIYFRVWEGTDRALRFVSTEGGEVSPVPMPISGDIDDISPDSSEFLVENLADRKLVPDPPDQYYSLWRVPVPTGSPRPTGVRTKEATWSPDGRTVAYSQASGLFQSDLDATHATQIAALPDLPVYLRWSPDGQHLRCSAGDGRRVGFFLWDADLSTRTARKLVPDLPASARPWTGGWTPDGKYFFYTAVADGTRNIYAIREKSDFLHRTNSAPVQLTNGPFTFYLPLPAKTSKRLFVVGEQLRGELVRYDTASQQFLPYAHSVSAEYTAFSPDGQWMAYVDYPQGNLERSRIDGSERRQLTYPPMHAFNPQWSPDGTQIAFNAVPDSGSHTKIYIVSASGGVATLATPPSDDRQIYPSWTSDGASILFSNSDVSQSHFDLRVLNLKTRQVSVLPGTDSLTLGQISPDGRYIIAVQRPAFAIALYDMTAHTIRTLSEAADYPLWSRDGKFVYFNDYYFSNKRKTGGVKRWNPATNAVEPLLKYPDFLLAGSIGVKFGLTPEGSILLLKDASNRDLYSLDLDLP